MLFPETCLGIVPSKPSKLGFEGFEVTGVRVFFEFLFLGARDNRSCYRPRVNPVGNARAAAACPCREPFVLDPIKIAKQIESGLHVAPV
jgi:hypothetical protein